MITSLVHHTLQLVYPLQILKLSDTLLKGHFFDMLHSTNNHVYYTYTCSLQDIITNVQLEYDIDLSPLNVNQLLLEFRRDFVVEDALIHAKKKKFNPEKTLKVTIIM